MLFLRTSPYLVVDVGWRKRDIRIWASQSRSSSHTAVLYRWYFGRSQLSLLSWSSFYIYIFLSLKGARIISRSYHPSPPRTYVFVHVLLQKCTDTRFRNFESRKQPKELGPWAGNLLGRVIFFFANQENKFCLSCRYHSHASLRLTLSLSRC